jgi:alkyl hydroperoxide reductase subunit F
VSRSNTDIAIRFIGLPLGHQFSALVLAILHVSGHPPRYSPAVTNTAGALEGHFEFETYFAQDCQSCPETLQALTALAVLNPHVTHTAIDGALFPDEMAHRDIQAVPVVYLNGRRFADGRMDLEQILTRLAREDTSSDED